MNAALPLLAILSLAGLLARRRGLGLAWAVSGLAAMLLLRGALALPDGIVSPSATLATIAPWHAAEPSAMPADDAAASNPVGNPLLRDVTFQIEPWLIALRSELRAGRLPFWNPWQFAGAPFWSNGQSAPLFPLHLLFAILPLRLGFLLLPWLRIVIAGCGAWALARALGVRDPAALFAAIVFPLSGMFSSFVQFPMGNALALAPWVLWSVERLASGEGSWRVLAMMAGLQMLAGHPETVLHTALLGAVYLLARRAPPAVWMRGAMALACAAAVAAVQLLPLAYLVHQSSRWAASAAASTVPLATFLEQPLRLVLPQMFGHPAAADWWGPFNYSATAVYAGALALPLAAAGWQSRRGDRRWLGVVCMVVLSALAAYQVPGVRQGLESLPLLGRALQHRLLFGVDLGLALLAATGLEAWVEGRGRRGLWLGWLVVCGAVFLSWTLFAGAWRAHGLSPDMIRDSVLAVAAGGALVGATFAPARWRRACTPLLLAGVALELAVAHGNINPGLPFAQSFPSTPGLRFLAQQAGRMAAVGESLRPNAAMVYGLRDLRGDDPLKTARFEAAYRTVAAPSATYFEPIREWSAPALDAWSLRWVLTGPNEAPPRPEWIPRYSGLDARVFERPSALPMVRWQSDGDERGLRVLAQAPGRWDVAWQAPRADTLIVAESAAEGWRAESAAGASLPVSRVEPGILAIAVGPGAGRVLLRYRPPGFLAGAGISLLGALVLSAAAWRARRVA